MRFLAAVLLVLAFSVPASAVRSGCVIVGTQHSDIISGNDGANVICTLGANDYAAGQGGRDKVRGGSGDDTLVGGSEQDRVIGRAGDDFLFAVDGHGGDVVKGGRGFDRCYGEKRDKIRCEVRVTNQSPSYPLKLALALSHALEGTIRVAERQENHLCDVILGASPVVDVCVTAGK